ncbi:MAG: RCC1 repeat-containing protein [Tepidiformaceae bacterium]
MSRSFLRGACALLGTLFCTFGVRAAAQSLLSGVAQISAGYEFTCAVLDGGGIACWGSNEAGQLGDGTYADHGWPVRIDVGGPASAVVAGTFHTCAIVEERVACWGSNTFGQLGNGGTDSQPLPQPVQGIVGGATAVATGYAHTCAVIEGGAWCWGVNQDGELGNGTLDSPITTPVQVQGLTAGVSTVSSGWSHSCAIIDGGVKCWGDNAAGQLGNGTFIASSVPVAAAGLESGVTAIASYASTSCAIVQGSLKCWGSGVLGDGTFGSNTPVDVPGVHEPAVVIRLGGSNCASSADHEVSCWGDNPYGQYGDGGYTASSIPVPVSLTPLDPGTLAAGGSHSCALTGGTAYCWGGNDHGQLGIGNPPESSPVPGSIRNLHAARLDLRMGWTSTCAIADSALLCWGANNQGELGDGTLLPRGEPVAVSGLAADVTEVSLLGPHTCAIVDGGAVCWGSNYAGELGDGTTTPRIVAAPVLGLGHGVLHVAVGAFHSCAIVAGGGVKCWGSGGLLGDGTTSNASEPVDVAGITNATAIAAGSLHTCVIDGGAAKCWGQGSFGQLGGGSSPTNPVLEPTLVVGLGSGVTAIAAGDYATCATVTGALRCWGYNGYGQLGNGTYVDSNVPVAVTGLDSGTLAITLGSSHACATLATGMKCWGSNFKGELGSDSPQGQSPVPVDVTVLPAGATSIVAGKNATCAVVGQGGLCWGDNLSGALGTGGIPWSPSPQGVVAGDDIFVNGFEAG